ncbi:MAG: DUF2130 domain-containing protein [Planctomycetes bacterium]|nr:DUF2130 domain-containing protein [Planctomycetota bacterium]
MSVHVTCPQCRAVFDATTALQNHVEGEVAERLQTARQQLLESATAQARQSLGVELQAKEAALQGLQTRLQAAERREVELLGREQAVEQKQREQQLELQRQLASERDKLTKEIEARANQAFALQLQAKEKSANEALAQVEAARRREAELLGREQAVAARQRDQELELQRQLASERDKLAKEIEARANQAFELRLQAKEKEAGEAQGRLRAAMQSELDVRKRLNELEEQARAQALQVQQQLDEERARIREAATQEATAQAALKQKEADELNRQLREKLEDAQRKLAQGSQQAQGEAQEIVLEDVLRTAFPRDGFAAVEKGVEGADVVQTVRDERGRDCGTILWESKRTRNWSDGWIGKLESDRARQNASVAALATQAMPRGVEGIGQVGDVWVCAFGQAAVLAALLRRGILEAASARQAEEGRADKMTLVYRYLTGPDFRNRAGAMIQGLHRMREVLDRERAAMNKIWAQRERLMALAVGGISGLQADLQGIAGADLAAIPDSDDGVDELEDVARGPVPGALPGLLAPAAGGVLGGVDDEALAETFVQALRGCGGTSGNISLLRELGWDQDSYDRIKAMLIARRVIGTGMGRGGSVRLLVADGQG